MPRLSLLETRAAAGDAEAQYAMARVLQAGRCGRGDISRALELYERAARSGHADAAFALGAAHFSSTGGPGGGGEGNPKLAERYFRIAAMSGHVRGQHSLAMAILVNGADLAARYEALYWLGSAAAHGDGLSAAVLAMIHERGAYGFSRDLCFALRWYQAAEALGFAEMQRRHSALRAQSADICS